MKIKTTIFALACLASINVQAGIIENGDFQTCDFSGWNKDTDGAGDISTGNDFRIDVNGSDCRAALEVDYFSPIGDVFGAPLNDVYFANTLFQSLDFSGGIDNTFQLSINFDVETQGNNQDPLFVADYFLIGLNDGLGNYFDANGNTGFLVSPTDINSAFSNTVTFDLDSSFNNTSNWFLDIQLNVGVDHTSLPDAFGSTLYINDVSLIEKVPEPSTLAVLSLALFGLITRKKQLK